MKIYRGFSRKAPGGWGFFSPIFLRLAKKKAPTHQVFFRKIMKRNFCIIENDEQGKRRKLQQTITSMFQATGPEFVEAPGLQLVCPYCHHKFKAPQGLISHKYMHERAGHKIPPKKKIAFFKSPLASSVEQAAKEVEVSLIKVQRESSQPKDQDEEESQKEVTPESEVF